MKKIYCRNCGTELAEGTKFCTNCGEKIEEDTEILMEEKVESSDSLNEGENNMEKNQLPKEQATLNSEKETNMQVKKSKNKKSLLIGAIVAVVAAIVCVIAAMNAKPTIKLADYTTVDVTGYDGVATANVSIDWDAIQEKYGDKIKFSSAMDKEAQEYGINTNLISMLGSPMDYMKMSYTANADKTTELSNDDTITVKYSGEEDVSKYFSCNVVLDSLEYKVSDLKEADKKDIFNNLKVEFSGVSGNGSLSYNYEGNENINFSADNSYNLSNGDKVTIKANVNDMNEFVEKYGYVPETLEKTYTISNMKSYCKSIAEIPQAAKDAMKAQADDEITAKKASANSSSYGSYTYGDSSYVGDYMLTMKTSASNGWFSSYNNKYGIVYKFTYTDKYKDVTKDSYIVFVFTNISANEDGEYEVELDNILTDGYIGTYSVSNYESLDDVKQDVVDSNLDDYVAEWTLS